VCPDWQGARKYGFDDVALKGGILGRIDDMVLIRGVNVYPSAVDQIVRECGGVEEYRVFVRTVRGLAELEMQIEAGGDSEIPVRLARLLQERLSLRIPIECVPSGSLPRFEMKAKRWTWDQA
jgi:phenylacetate-CoA ligase